MRTHLFLSFALLVGTSAVSATVASADTIYIPPTLSGKQIDRCVNDGVRNNCDSTANRIAATAFCRARGDQEAVSWSIDLRNIKPKSLKRAAKTLRGSLQFVDILGLHAFTKIVCKSDRVTRDYYKPTRNGMRIDRCVQGAGWGLFDPKRCDSTRRNQVAKKFCLEKGFRDKFSYQLENHVGNHAILTFPKGTSYRNGVWTQVAGSKAFKRIICVR